jgi:Tol biopolymer transport system component
MGIEEDGVGTQMFRMPIAGGEEEKMSDLHANGAVFSPDGSRIAIQAFDPEARRWKIHIMEFETREILQKIDTRFNDFAWAPDGNSLTLSRFDEGAANIWNHPLDGSEETRITNFDRDFIAWFRWDPSGERLLVDRGDQTADIVLLRNFR